MTTTQQLQSLHADMQSTHTQREKRALDAIRDRLRIPTADLSDNGLREAQQTAHELWTRLCIEEYGRRKGWDQHTYAFGSPGWEELTEAWLSDTGDSEAA